MAGGAGRRGAITSIIVVAWHAAGAAAVSRQDMTASWHFRCDTMFFVFPS
jgi:hypothetical protein